MLEFWLGSKTPLSQRRKPNQSARIQFDCHKLSKLSHKLNGGESKDYLKLHPGESKWTLIALYEILPLKFTQTVLNESQGYRGFAQQDAHLYAHKFATSLGFLLYSTIWRKTKTTTKNKPWTLDLFHEMIQNFNPMCIMIFLSLIWMWYELNSK